MMSTNVRLLSKVWREIGYIMYIFSTDDMFWTGVFTSSQQFGRYTTPDNDNIFYLHRALHVKSRNRDGEGNIRMQSLQNKGLPQNMILKGLWKNKHQQNSMNYSSRSPFIMEKISLNMPRKIVNTVNVQWLGITYQEGEIRFWRK